MKKSEAEKILSAVLAMSSQVDTVAALLDQVKIDSDLVALKIGVNTVASDIALKLIKPIVDLYPELNPFDKIGR